MDYPPNSTAIGERIEYVFEHTVPELCEQTNVSADAVRVVFDMLRPRLDEARDNLPPIGSQSVTDDGKPVKTKDSQSTNFSSLLLMYDSLDRIEDEEMDRININVNRIPRWMLPRRGLSEKAWAGAFSKIRDSAGLNLDETEMQALKKIDYIVYVECVYSVVVNRLCYALAHSDSPSGLDNLTPSPSIPYLVYEARLAKKIKFIRSNTERPPKGVPDITEACDIDLRNTIAHGSLVGKPAGVAPHFFKNVAQMEDPTYVTCFDGMGSLKSIRPVDLAAECEKVRAATNVWNLALNMYWNLEFSGWWSVPRSRWLPHGFDLRPDG